MKAIWLTRNRRGRRGAPRVSLFPFLAVLICTMGALMLLLFLVTREARLQAARLAVAKDAEKQSSIAAELEMVQWRVDQLKNSRKETEAQLSQARLVLGHIEDHGRRLRDQFQDLSIKAKRAADEGRKLGRFVAAGEEELRQVEGQIAEAQKQLSQTQQAVADRPKSYAIIPYDGPNRTRRRPIYLECRGDAVVLQPENIAFNESDFDEPLGPGNPLAAAVRAAREQMLLQASADPQDAGEPYPLLLVRPDGISFYEVALAAMKSWGSEFGYELINADWQLKYPPPDPNVAKSVAQAIFLARQEHARLIAAAPSKYGKRPRAGSFRASAVGEAVGQDGAGSPGVYSSKPSERYARAGGAGGSSGTGHGGQGGGSGVGGNGTGGNGTGGNGTGGNGGGGTGTGSGGGLAAGDGPSGDAEFAANNPYAALPTPSAGGPPTMSSGGYGSGSGYGFGSGGGGLPGTGAVGGSGAMVQGGNPTGGPGAGMPGVGTHGVGNGAATVGPGASGNGAGLGSGYLANGSQAPGGTGGTTMGGQGGNANPTGTAPGIAAAGGPAGSPANAGGTTNAVCPPGGASGTQFTGQGSGGASGTRSTGQGGGGASASVAVVRPDGYIDGRPNDGTPPAPVRPDPGSSVATGPAVPLRPGEWRPSEETNPKRDRDEEEKEKKEKKKHPYDKVRLDHDQDDWALRNASRHAAAISRPIHVDCLADRIVLAPETAGGEPHVILREQGGPREADKLVAAIWEIMDTWGMAGREMYWRPILNFYVAPGAEPHILDLTRSLEGSGLVIERKQ